MPVYRKPSQAIDDLHLPTNPDCVVRMRRRGETGMRYDAEDYILQHRAEFQPNGTPKREVLGETYTVAMWQLLILALVESWDLEDEAGERWPYTVASLRRLDPIDSDFLEREARRRMEGLDSPFGSTLPPPSTASESPTTPASSAPSPSSSSLTATDGLPASSEASGQPTSNS